MSGFNHEQLERNDPDKKAQTATGVQKSGMAGIIEGVPNMGGLSRGRSILLQLSPYGMGARMK